MRHWLLRCRLQVSCRALSSHAAQARVASTLMPLYRDCMQQLNQQSHSMLGAHALSLAEEKAAAIREVIMGAAPLQGRD
jgi:hypothetical protein